MTRRFCGTNATSNRPWASRAARSSGDLLRPVAELERIAEAGGVVAGEQQPGGDDRGETERVRARRPGGAAGDGREQRQHQHEVGAAEHGEPERRTGQRRRSPRRPHRDHQRERCERERAHLPHEPDRAGDGHRPLQAAEEHRQPADRGPAQRHPAAAGEAVQAHGDQGDVDRAEDRAEHDRREPGGDRHERHHEQRRERREGHVPAAFERREVVGEVGTARSTRPSRNAAARSGKYASAGVANEPNSATEPRWTARAAANATYVMHGAERRTPADPFVVVQLPLSSAA
jgi:hypothetical protein